MASSICSPLIILLTLIFSFSVGSGNYEYLTMALQWGPAVCRQSVCKRAVIIRDKLTLHGMWPSNHSDPQPRACFISGPIRHLNPKKLPKELVKNLKISWPSYFLPDEDFWVLQWFTHGTCSYPTIGQKQYFYLADNHWQGMPLFDILGREGIVPVPYATPGKSYNRNDVIAAIKKHYFHGEDTIEPEFYCSGSELKEIRLCLDKKGFGYINCTSGAGTCGQTFQWLT